MADLNGDGYGDGHRDAGLQLRRRPRLFKGGASELTSSSAMTVTTAAELGTVTALAEDVDGDGWLDLAISEPRKDHGLGP